MGRIISFIQSNPIERWLNKKLYESKYVYLDNWSFVHLAVGMLLGYFFYNYYPVKNTWLVVLALLVGYEFFEWMLWGILFRRESKLNIYWDVVVGMAGICLYWILFII